MGDVRLEKIHFFGGGSQKIATSPLIPPPQLLSLSQILPFPIMISEYAPIPRRHRRLKCILYREKSLGKIEHQRQVCKISRRKKIKLSGPVSSYFTVAMLNVFKLYFNVFSKNHSLDIIQSEDHKKSMGDSLNNWLVVR